MAHFIVEESGHKMCNQHFWSDSTTVLFWLRAPQVRHKIFVANRLANALDICNPHNWKYVPTKKIRPMTALEVISLKKDDSVALVAGTTNFLEGPISLAETRSASTKSNHSSDDAG